MQLDPYGNLASSTKSWRRMVVMVALWAIMIVTWTLIVPGRVSPLKLPSPQALIAAEKQLSTSLLSHILWTLARTLLGFVIGSCFGLLVAFAMFTNRWVKSILYPFIELVRPVPPIALIPFLILWFKLSFTGQIVLVGLGSFMVLVVSTYESLLSVSVELRRAATSLGVNRWSYHSRVLLPVISPYLLAPLRVSLALAFALAIASEFMGAQSGIGFVIMVARRTLHTETILLGIVVLGVLCASLDGLLRLAWNRFTRWAI